MFSTNLEPKLEIKFGKMLFFCEENAYSFFCLECGLQVQLYEDFAKSRAKCDIDETVSSISLREETEKPKLKATGHVFQVQFLFQFSLTCSLIYGSYKCV